MWNQQLIRVRYRRWAREREVTRTLEPLGLVLKGGIWYLVARASGQVRTYRVSHIRELAPLSEQHQAVGRFLSDGVLEGVGEVRLGCVDAYQVQPLQPGEIVAQARPIRLPYFFHPAATQAARESAGPPDGDGRTRVVLPIESAEHARADLLRLGADAEVLAPPELRERMAATAGALARLYRPR